MEQAFQKLIDNILKLDISDTKKSKLVNDTYKAMEHVEILQNEQIELKKRIVELEDYVYNDIEDFETDTTFVCPYCNRKVHVYMNNDKMDMACPFCKNEVVLEWSRGND